MTHHYVQIHQITQSKKKHVQCDRIMPLPWRWYFLEVLESKLPISQRKYLSMGKMSVPQVLLRSELPPLCILYSFGQTRVLEHALLLGFISQHCFQCGLALDWTQTYFGQKFQEVENGENLPFLGFGAGFASDHPCVESIQLIQYMGRLKWKPC